MLVELSGREEMVGAIWKATFHYDYNELEELGRLVLISNSRTIHNDWYFVC